MAVSCACVGVLRYHSTCRCAGILGIALDLLRLRLLDALPRLAIVLLIVVVVLLNGELEDAIQ